MFLLKNTSALPSPHLVLATMLFMRRQRVASRLAANISFKADGFATA
jgi:hypothetical protein